MKFINFSKYTDNTYTELFDLIKTIQGDNLTLLMQSIVKKPGLKLVSDNDFKFYISGDYIYCNLGSCVFNDYSYFVPSGNQTIALPFSWDKLGSLTYALVICQDDLDWSHTYIKVPVKNQEATPADVYGQTSACIALVTPGSIIPGTIVIGYLNGVDKTITDERFNHQLEMIKPASFYFQDITIPGTYSIEDLSVSLVYDTDSLTSNKPRPASMHKGRRVVAKFLNKDAYSSKSFLGFALKFTSLDGQPQEYSRFFSQGEVIQNYIYLSSLVPHDIGKLTITVYGLFKVHKKVMVISSFESILIPSIHDPVSVSIKTLFQDSGILRFTIEDEVNDYLIYIKPSNSTSESINDDQAFQAVIQGGEYDYIMPSGYRYIYYKVRSLNYGRKSFKHKSGSYSIYDHLSREYAMTLTITLMTPGASGTLFTIPLPSAIQIVGAQITNLNHATVTDAGVIRMREQITPGTFYPLPYNDMGEGKNFNGSPINIDDTLEIVYISDTNSDLSDCTLTIHYRYLE